MGAFSRILFYSLIFYLLYRIIVRLFISKKRKPQNPYQQTKHSNLEKAKYNIQAEDVDFEEVKEDAKK